MMNDVVGRRPMQDRAVVPDHDIANLPVMGVNERRVCCFLEQTREQLSRTPRALPQMRIKRTVESIFDFRYEDFELLNYDPLPHIKAAVAV